MRNDSNGEWGMRIACDSTFRIHTLRIDNRHCLSPSWARIGEPTADELLAPSRPLGENCATRTRLSMEGARMSRPSCLACLVPFLVVSLTSLCTQQAVFAAARRPNVVLIITDDQGWG